MEIKFTEENLRKIDEIKSHYPTADSALLPVLWLAQEQFGWISLEVMQYIGDLLNIPYERVYGVVSFYTMFNKKPVGKYHLQVCTNVSCMLRGAYEILEHICKKLNILVGETTPDKKFTVTEAECLGSCGTAPMLQLNNYFKENLTKDNIDKLLEELHKS
jgi:NADH-quinone oxidoreductase E subunit